MQEIVINIPSDRNGSIPISIQARLTDSSYDRRNQVFVFKIDSIEPENATIPRTSENMSESLIVKLSKEMSFSNWRIRQIEDNFVLKTYPNSSNMILDKKFENG